MSDSNEDYQADLAIAPRSNNSLKKNSLKFLRRVCRSALLYLGKPDFLNKITNALADILITHINLLNGTKVDKLKIKETICCMLNKIWKDQRQTLTYWKNNKISIIKAVEWDSVFSFQGFSKQIQTYGDNIYLLSFPNDHGNKELFTLLFRRIMYIFHIMLINTFLSTEIAADLEFCKKMTNLKDFILMANEPWLYKHYNHSAGRFANACCGRCKVCCSTSVPSDFSELLLQARGRFEIINSFYRALRVNINKISEERLKIMMSFFSENTRTKS